MTDHERTQAAIRTYIAWGIERAQHHANQRTTP